MSDKQGWGPQRRLLAWRRELIARGLISDPEGDRNAICTNCESAFAIPYYDSAEADLDPSCRQCENRRNELCVACCADMSPDTCPIWEPPDESEEYDYEAAYERDLAAHMKAGEIYYSQLEGGGSWCEEEGDEDDE